MKLRNKKTGEIYIFGETQIVPPSRCGMNIFYKYNSLAELNAEWCDVEEPKGSALGLMILTLTNFIENEPDEDKVDLEDCKQMLEKLKAWERLKDKGFRFNGLGVHDNECISFDYSIDYDKEFNTRGSQTRQDLDLLFGGEDA